MYSTEAYACKTATSKFEKITIERNECGDNDVDIDILYCGICHTDVHLAKNHMDNTTYPIVPGHEVAGKVIKVGKNVRKLKAGDHVGVGCIVDSCMSCTMCNKGSEHFCEREGGMSWSYNSNTVHGHIKTNSGYTFGGYSKRITVDQRYAIVIPKSYPLEYAGPIFCSAITVYSPLKLFGCVSGGKRVGVCGIGGLGQMGISLASAMGCEVTAISTTPRKEETAKKLGAKHFIVSSDPESMKKGAQSLDLIINTISADHQISHYTQLLAYDGTIVQIGWGTKEPHQVTQASIVFGRISITGSLIGGMPDTQDVINFCAEKNIKPIIEVVTPAKLDEVYDTLEKKNDAVLRYVLDLTNA